MYISDLSNGISGGRLFLYEVIIRQRKNAQSGKIPQRRSGRFFLKAPYSRMQQTMAEISALGGEIVSIKALDRTTQAPDVLLNLPWWIEIKTTKPRCLYYFGPFESWDEANSHQSGYVEDLRQEEAENISLEIKQFNPKVLTIEW
jgi:hypothetical protein